MIQELITTFITSLIPIFELRGAIPYALLNGVPLFLAVFIAVIGNLLVIPLVFFFLEYLNKYFLLMNWYKNLFDKIVLRTRKKIDAKFAKYEYWALFLFVAIPLPVTGAYTGTLAAWLLGVERKKAALYLGLGVVAAALIVTLLTLGGILAWNQ